MQPWSGQCHAVRPDRWLQSEQTVSINENVISAALAERAERPKCFLSLMQQGTAYSFSLMPGELLFSNGPIGPHNEVHVSRRRRFLCRQNHGVNKWESTPRCISQKSISHLEKNLATKNLQVWRPSYSEFSSLIFFKEKKICDLIYVFYNSKKEDST